MSNVKAKFIGYQEMLDGEPAEALFNILEGHPRCGSTVCLATLEQLGVEPLPYPTYEAWKLAA